MDSIEKFKNYLETEMINIKEKLYNYRKNTSRGNWDMKNMAISSIQYLCYRDILMFLKHKRSELFGNFLDISLMLQDSGLRGMDCFQVILYFIERNIENGILEEEDIELKKCCRMMDITNNMVDQVILGEYYSIYTIRDEENARKKLKSSPVPLEMNTLIYTHKQLQECYLDKKHSYTESDIQKIIEILYELGIDSCLCSNIEISLKKELKKRERELNAQKEHSIKSVVYEVKSDNMNIITDKEYKAIRKQIAEYYDEYTGEVLKSVTDEEMIQISSLMIQLGYDREKINQFYMSVIRSRGNIKMDSVTEFLKLYPKIEFYRRHNPILLDKLLEEGIDYLYETFRCKKDEYDFWYQAIYDVVFQLKMIIPNKYDYEYEQAKQFLEQAKQKKKKL